MHVEGSFANGADGGTLFHDGKKRMGWSSLVFLSLSQNTGDSRTRHFKREVQVRALHYTQCMYFGVIQWKYSNACL